MMEYVDTQLMSNLSAISVTVICFHQSENYLVEHYPPFTKWSDSLISHPQQWFFCHFWTFTPTGTPTFV